MLDIILLGGLLFLINMIISPMLNGLLDGCRPILKIGGSSPKPPIYSLEEEDGIHHVVKREFIYRPLPYIKTGYLLLPASVLVEKRHYTPHEFSPEPLTDDDLLAIGDNPEMFPYDSLQDYWNRKYFEHLRMVELEEKKKEDKVEKIQRVKRILGSQNS